MIRIAGRATLRAQPGHEFEPVHVGHPVIDQETTVRRQGDVAQKLRGARVQADLQSFELQDEFQGVADGLVVVDDEDRPRELRHCGARSFVGPA